MVAYRRIDGNVVRILKDTEEDDKVFQIRMRQQFDKDADEILKIGKRWKSVKKAAHREKSLPFNKEKLPQLKDCQRMVSKKIGIPPDKMRSWKGIAEHIGFYAKDKKTAKKCVYKYLVEHCDLQDNIQTVKHSKKRKNKTSTKKKSKLKFVQTNEFLSSYEWRRARYKVLKNSNGKCQLCGRSAHDGIILNVDHIKPRKTHPELALKQSNLQILCNDCNHGKGNLDDTDWR